MSLGSPLSLKRKSSPSVPLREVVSHIIEDLAVSDAEEDLAGAVTPVQQEAMCREGKKCYQSGRGPEDLIKLRSFSGDLQSERRLHCAVDAGADLIQVHFQTRF